LTTKKNKKIFIHNSTFIDKGVFIGEGTKIWHFCHIMQGVRVGKNCILGQSVFVGENVKIGDGVKLQNNVSLFEGVELAKNVFCGPNVTFTNVKKPRAQFPVHKKYASTRVGEGVTIGANTTLICPLTIGKYAFIGAGAVVSKNVPDYGLAYGNPAKLKGFVCQCAERLKFKKNKAKCLKCGRTYQSRKEKVRLIRS